MTEYLKSKIKNLNSDPFQYPFLKFNSIDITKDEFIGVFGKNITDSRDV